MFAQIFRYDFNATVSLILVLGVQLVGCQSNENADTSLGNDDSGSRVAFEDVTHSAGLSAFRHVNGALGKKWFPETMGSGAAFFDYDGDGRQDIVLVGGGSWPESPVKDVRALWLYRNLGDGTFADVTVQAGLDGLRDYGFGVVAADYDNDGDQDLYLTTLTRNRLLRNTDGRFEDVAGAAGVAGGIEWSTAAVFFDADLDGLLDLFVGNYVRWSPERDLWCSSDGVDKVYCTPQLHEGIPGRFYRNLGGGVFEDASAASRLVASGKTLGAVEIDYNRDGWPDLVVTNDTEPDQLFENRGDGTFRDIGIESGIAFDEFGRARAGMGVDAGDVTGDDLPTIFVGNFSDEMIGVYGYLGDGIFVDRAASSRVGRPSLRTLTFGLFLFDVDLDGDLDLFAANGHINEEIETARDNTAFRQRPHLFVNDGSGRFADVAATVEGLNDKALVARGAAYADYDGDGDLDVVITENDGAVHLWSNRLSGGNGYLRVRLRGTSSNRDGIGSKISVLVNGRRQSRRIRSGLSYLSSSELVATFGLGPEDSVDTLTVKWPRGHESVRVGVEGDRTIDVAEVVDLAAQAE